MNRKNWIGLLAIGTIAALTLTQTEQKIPQIFPVHSQPEVEETQDFPFSTRHLLQKTLTIKPGTTFQQLMTESGLNAQGIFELHRDTKNIRDFSRIRSGQIFQVYHTLAPIQELQAFKIIESELERHAVYRQKNGPWVAKHIKEPVEYINQTYSGVVSSSLWSSAEEAEMSPELIGDLSEIFAWQIDFSREVQPEDKWRLVVEQPTVRGKAVGKGKILVAEYANTSTSHTGVLFRLNGEDLGYFSPDGSSLKRMFLKAPVKFSRISSRFSRSRFHPILKTYRGHMGVDYAAATGTPVRSVGDGRVTFAAWSGGGGRVIKIRHNGTYETAYKHLSKFANNLRTGTRVKQGQIIGYVGSSGLSSGPHLHFEFYENKRYVDPLGKKFPKADPVPQERLREFQADGMELIKQLPNWMAHSRA